MTLLCAPLKQDDRDIDGVCICMYECVEWYIVDICGLLLSDFAIYVLSINVLSTIVENVKH